MKRFALIAALACTLHASQPTEAELNRYLADAKQEWNADLDVSFRVEPMGACPISTTKKGGIIPGIALTEVHWTTTTLVLDDGSRQSSTAYRYVILLNSNCDWSLLPTDRVMSHELGHCVLGADYHSADKRSVMYPVPARGSKVMEADRK